MINDIVIDITALFLKNILSDIARKNSNTTSAIEVETHRTKKYILNENMSNGITVDKNVEFRVLDDLKIDWENAKRDIFMSLDWNDLKVGEINEMEIVIRNLINMSTQIETMTWLNQLYLDYNKNVLFVCTLLHTLSHMEYEEVIPQGPTMAMASLNHEDDRVIGYAIKAFSNWNSKSTISLMKTNIPNIYWAKKEWNRVVEYIEKFGDENNELLNENDQSNERVDTGTA